ncbi:sensor histidine kinase [Larkinella sp. VNQ87]|uniref:sensor histidine kinase n=1 Tax=Larkinella sp. VNQ87 TaxID=3400921 RepID=UPI003C02C4B6
MATPISPVFSSDELTFPHLGRFARFLLDNHLEELAAEFLRLFREVKLPMLVFFESMPEEQILQLSKQTSARLLTAFIENRVVENIETTLQSWAQTLLPVIGRNQIATNEIALVSYVRKQALVNFLNRYTRDAEELVALIREIDRYILELDSRSMKQYISLLNRDINEQLHFNEKLTDTSPGIIYVFDLIERREVFTNRKIEPILGYTPEEIRDMGENYLETVHHANDIPRILAHFDSFVNLEDGQVQTFEHRMKDKSGRYRWLRNYESIFRRKPDGSPWQIIGLALDIEQEKQSTQLLEEKQNFIQKITDAAPAIIATFNINSGQYQFISQGFELLLGHSPQQVLDEGIAFLLAILHPDDLPRLMEENARALEKANQMPESQVQVSEFQYRMRHRNGTYRWFRTFGTVFDRNPEGNVEHILNISLDITEKVEAEHKLEEKNRRLEQSNASLQEFAYIASHDLKEPLRKISTFGERLLQTQRGRMDPEGDTYLEKIVEAAHRMHRLIGDVLSVSLISADQTFKVQSLQVLVDEVLETLDYQIEQIGADIRTDQLPVAPVVATQFRQLFQNLLTNALKFSRKDSPLQVRITHRFLSASGELPAGLSPARRFLELTIADNGIGFDNRYAHKIFAIFQRLHARKDFEGTGIGLAICKKIVENHGGVISAKGVPNQGATFTIVLPA